MTVSERNSRVDEENISGSIQPEDNEYEDVDINFKPKQSNQEINQLFTVKIRARFVFPSLLVSFSMFDLVILFFRYYVFFCNLSCRLCMLLVTNEMVCKMHNQCSSNMI
ncbi:unnamed protein product [Schistosoma curassoni]|uniref:CTNNB1 binding N-teminal domain-containing protein n=1 Tax=Schistosoma curassoni TaxID=6186 RepID=A0A183L5V5_9TREM|nr:unnamed protein product [Schistosoma curassoni]